MLDSWRVKTTTSPPFDARAVNVRPDRNRGLSTSPGLAIGLRLIFSDKDGRDRSWSPCASASPRGASKTPPSSFSPRPAGRSPVRARNYFPAIDDRRAELRPGAFAGDGSLCGRRWRAGLRPDRPRLGDGDRSRRRSGSAIWSIRARRTSRPRAGCWWSTRPRPFRDSVRRGSRRARKIATELVNFTRRYLTERGIEATDRVLLGHHRGQGRPGPRRCRRRTDRDRKHHPRPRPAGSSAIC